MNIEQWLFVFKYSQIEYRGFLEVFDRISSNFYTIVVNDS